MKIHKLCQILSSQTRLKILSLLLDRELCVCQIYSVIGTTQPNISQHMNVLKRFGIVEVRKEGSFVYYSLNKRFLQNHQCLEMILKDAKEQFSKPLSTCNLS